MAPEKEKLNLKVITPDNIKCDENVDMVIMRCITGDWGVLPRHEARSAVLGNGVLRIINGHEERKMAVFGGIVQVRDNVVTILTDHAQWPEELARAEAESANKDMSGVAMQESQVQMRRILVQMEVSSYPLINNSTDRKS